ncbi:unnamed protein product, partial [marine sediment metagenome]
ETMVKSGKNLNSVGRVTGGEVMDVTLRNLSGLPLMTLYRSGRLSIDIQNISEKSGYLHETLFLTLQLSKDGSISGKWVLS